MRTALLRPFSLFTFSSFCTAGSTEVASAESSASKGSGVEGLAARAAQSSRCSPESNGLLAIVARERRAKRGAYQARR